MLTCESCGLKNQESLAVVDNQNICAECWNMVYEYDKESNLFDMIETKIYCTVWSWFVRNRRTSVLKELELI